ncbi:hypothetical protein [Deinococcus aquiradiocola]|nr:hypothetical protein [Deinococcus aquiradiocola]
MTRLTFLPVVGLPLQAGPRLPAGTGRERLRVQVRCRNLYSGGLC